MQIPQSNFCPYCSEFISAGLYLLTTFPLWAMYHVRLRFCYKTSGHGSKILLSRFLTQETCSGKWIHLAHPPGHSQKRNFLNKAFLILTQKNFQTKNVFKPLWKNHPPGTISCPTPKKKFLPRDLLKTYPKQTSTFHEKKFLHLLEKTDFLPKEKSLLLTWKYNQRKHFL